MRKCGEKLRGQIRDDGGNVVDTSVWRMLWHGDTNSLHRETPKGRGEVGYSLCHIPVAWLRRGEEAKNDHYNH